MTLEVLAEAAISAALSFVAATGKGVASAVGKDTWQWLKANLTRDDQKALLQEIHTQPAPADTTALRNAIVAELALSPLARTELERLLNMSDGDSKQSTHLIGDKNVVNQAIGAGITISVSKTS
ncbi:MULTISPECIES: hypothetical protein [Rhodopseudomonas]|uniref:hypothetical protein n=1 Tax=Rhodopseudomonas TaxID=1073 RepID=UPI00123758CE|nr:MULTISPECIES: hypothetical protein [Rhodopseudomonas]